MSTWRKSELSTEKWTFLFHWPVASCHGKWKVTIQELKFSVFTLFGHFCVSFRVDIFRISSVLPSPTMGAFGKLRNSNFVPRPLNRDVFRTPRAKPEVRNTSTFMVECTNVTFYSDGFIKTRFGPPWKRWNLAGSSWSEKVLYPPGAR